MRRARVVVLAGLSLLAAGAPLAQPTHGPGPGDEALRAAARALYGDAVHLQALASPELAAAFPGLEAFEALQLTRHPAPVQRLAWDPAAEQAWDLTAGYAALLAAHGGGLLDPPAAGRHGLPFAVLADADLLPPRQVVGAADAARLGYATADPTVAPRPGGWLATLHTWSPRNGLVAAWRLAFTWQGLEEASWTLVHAGDAEAVDWEAPSPPVGARVLHRFPGGHAASAWGPAAGGGEVPYLLPAQAQGIAYPTVASRATFDGSVWVAGYPGPAGEVGPWAAALLGAAADAYGALVDRSATPCAGATNPARSLGHVARDPDCTLEVRILPQAALGCRVCAEPGPSLRLWASAGLPAHLRELGWQGPGASLDAAARTAVRHALHVALAATDPARLPEVAHAPLPGDMVDAAGRLDPEHAAPKALDDPAFASLREALAREPGFRGLAPAVDGRPALTALFLGAPPPELPLGLLPAGWTLQALGSASAVPLTLAYPPELPPDELVPSPASGIGPGAHLLIHRPEGTIGCTSNFVWRGPGGALYLGTAGHCVNADPARTTIEVCVAECYYGGRLGFFYGGDLETLGPVVFARAGGVGGDFGLVAIPEDLHGLVRYGQPVWGGPTGALCPDARGDPALAPVVMYGYGLAWGEVWLTMARAGHLLDCGFFGPDFLAALPAGPGDSGAAVELARVGDGALLRGEEALGVLTHATGLGEVGAPPIWGTHIDRVPTLVEEALGWAPELVCADGQPC